MERKEILCVKKDTSDNITHVGGKSIYNVPWKHTVDEVITNIEGQAFEYYVSYDGQEATIVVVNDPDGKYIRTSLDDSESNNLDELKVCT